MRPAIIKLRFCHNLFFDGSFPDTSVPHEHPAVSICSDIYFSIIASSKKHLGWKNQMKVAAHFLFTPSCCCSNLFPRAENRFNAMEKIEDTRNLKAVIDLFSSFFIFHQTGFFSEG